MLNKYFQKSKKTFLDFFPPPGFLTMPAYGLNMSDHSIKVLELLTDHKTKVGKFGEEPIPDGAVKSGNINNKEALKGVLKSIKEKYGMSLVRVSIPEEKAYVFKLKIPKTDDEEEIRSSIEFRLEDNVPLSLNEAIFDYDIISTGHNSHIDVSVCVFPQKVVANYAGLFEEAGLTPLSFEIEASSIARAVIDKKSTDTYMIVDYGRTRTGFSVVSGGVVRYTSTVEIGGEPITEIIMKKKNLSHKEAEDIKNHKGILKDPENPELYMSFVNIVSALRDEINNRYIYWHTHKDEEGKVGNKIKKIILVGGNANLLGLDEYLSSSLKVRVEKADVWSNIAFPEGYIPPINFYHSLSYASAIGLAFKKFD